MQTSQECGRPHVPAGRPPKRTALGFGAGFPPTTPSLGAGLLGRRRGPVLVLPGIFAGLPAAALGAWHQECRGRLRTCGAGQTAAQARPPPPHCSPPPHSGGLGMNQVVLEAQAEKLHCKGRGDASSSSSGNSTVEHCKSRGKCLNVTYCFVRPRRLKFLNVLIASALCSLLTILFLPVLLRRSNNS